MRKDDIVCCSEKNSFIQPLSVTDNYSTWVKVKISLKVCCLRGSNLQRHWQSIKVSLFLLMLYAPVMSWGCTSTKQTTNCHSSLIACQWVALQTLWRFRLKDLSIDEMVGAWCFGCWAHRGLPVGFLLLPYSVLFTVESLSLLYLLIISWSICSRRWCSDKLGVFHANQTSMCLDPHLN